MQCVLPTPDWSGVPLVLVSTSAPNKKKALWRFAPLVEISICVVDVTYQLSQYLEVLVEDSLVQPELDIRHGNLHDYFLLRGNTQFNLRLYTAQHKRSQNLRKNENFSIWRLLRELSSIEIYLANKSTSAVRVYSRLSTWVLPFIAKTSEASGPQSILT